jgi:antibiotic biosynthesis monooxygenase (ABM) superfamily enzyme
MCKEQTVKDPLDHV